MKDYSQVDFNGLVARLYPSRAQLFAGAPLKIVGVRGADDKAGQSNSFATYDDQFLVFLDGAFTHSWVASTDPSWYFVQNPTVRDDTGSLHAGQLCPGVHLFGPHVLHGKYPCFGQAEDVHLYRLNRDGSINHIEYGDFAVCIHSGGAGMNTGRFSLACQILQNDDGYFGNPTWNRFYAPLRDALNRSGRDTFPYFLVNVADLSLPPAAPPAVTPGLPVELQPAPGPASGPPAVVATAPAVLDLLSATLAADPALAAVANGSRPGLARVVPAVLTPGIDRVQDALDQLNYHLDLGPGNADRGYFGPRTEAQVIAFQRTVAGLTPNGVISGETLFALDQALLKGTGQVPSRPATDTAHTVVVSVPRADGYLPPPASREFFGGIDFSAADASRGAKYVKKFAAADQFFYPRDPSRCRTLLRFPDGTLYFDSKLAVDTDGSPNAKKIDPDPDDASTKTSWQYPGTAKPVYFDAEQVPYIVLPMYDKNDGFDFLADMGQRLGNLAVVIYRDKIAGAIFADEGPTRKIGEGSVRLHETLGVNPWDRRHEKIIDSSIPEDVLVFVFPTSVGNEITPENAAQLIRQKAEDCFRQLGGEWS